MRLVKFLSITIFVTSVSLLYVYQQSEIFRLAYLGQKQQVFFNELLDKNTVLKYNINKGSSLVRIGNKVSASDDFQMPDTHRFVKFISSRDGLKVVQQSLPRPTLLARIFGINREAQAKPINP